MVTSKPQRKVGLSCRQLFISSHTNTATLSAQMGSQTKSITPFRFCVPATDWFGGPLPSSQVTTGQPSFAVIRELVPVVSSARVCRVVVIRISLQRSKTVVKPVSTWELINWDFFFQARADVESTPVTLAPLYYCMFPSIPSQTMDFA